MATVLRRSRSVSPTITGATIHANLPVARLYEEALRRNEGCLAAGGALVCATGAHTGRSPRDKFIVREAGTAPEVWWGTVNQELSPLQFGRIEDNVRRCLSDRKSST